MEGEELNAAWRRDAVIRRENANKKAEQEAALKLKIPVVKAGKKKKAAAPLPQLGKAKKVTPKCMQGMTKEQKKKFMTLKMIECVAAGMS